MKITNLIIKGFRSFDTEGVNLTIKEDLIAFIGINSSGKSTAMEGLRKMFGNSPYEKELIREDFHVSPNEEEVDKKELSVEVRIDFDPSEEDEIALYFSHMVVEQEGAKPYLRLRLEGCWEKSDVLEEGIIENKLYFIKVPFGEPESKETKVPCPPHLKSLIQIIYVPAIRKPGEQLKYASGSIFHRVLKKIKWGEQFKTDFDEKIKEINSLFDGIPEFTTIRTSINAFWKKFHKDKRYEEANLIFGGGDYETILKNLEVSFDPSGIHRPYGVNDLGEGYRSLFYITLVCALLEVEEQIAQNNEEIGNKGPLLTILAIEEPENHIAPQLLGRVINNLYKLSEKKKSQVVISSHTASIIKRVKPEGIYHFRIDTEKYKTAVSAIALPDNSSQAYKYIKEAIYNYPEIYFAKLVVIGEGDSEEILFNRLASVYNVNFDDNIITFVPLGHRFVNHIWKLLKSLNIPFITLLDLDIGREGGGWGRIKYALKQLILVGEEKSKLLYLADGTVMTDAALKEMHTWNLETKEEKGNLKSWINFLNDYNLFYSYPLDIDFLLLRYYYDHYINTIPKNGGPRIPDKTKELAKFNKKVESAVQATLKSEEAKGEFYTENQKERMVYYNYLFLGRGKPSTHIQALSAMSNEEIKANIPKSLVSIFNKILELLENPDEKSKG